MASITKTKIAVEFLPMSEAQLLCEKAFADIKRDCTHEDNSQDWQNSVLIKEEIEIAEDWQFTGEEGIYFEPEMCVKDIKSECTLEDSSQDWQHSVLIKQEIEGTPWAQDDLKKKFENEEDERAAFECVVTENLKGGFRKDVEVIDLSSDDSIEEKTVSAKTAAPILRRLLEQGPSSDEPRLLHETEPEFFCKQCGTSAASASELAIMCAWHTGERPFSCSVCDKCFVTRVQLCVHSIAHSRGQPFPCLICGEEISRMAHFRHHMALHDDSRNRPPCRCLHCHRTFRGDREWQRHLMRAHRLDRLTATSRAQGNGARAPVGSCCHCGLEFMNRGGLRRHELACSNYNLLMSDKGPSDQAVDINISSIRHKQDLPLA